MGVTKRAKVYRYHWDAKLRRSLILVLLATAPLRAQVAASATSGKDRMSLRDALQVALQQNKSLKASRAAVNASAARMQGAWAGMLPQLDYSESLTRSNNPVFVFSSLLEQRRFAQDNFQIGALNRPGFLDNFQSTLTVNQTLFDGGQTRQAVRSAELARDVSRQEDRQSRTEVMLSAIKSYLDAALSREALQAASDAVKSAEADLAQAESIRQAGLSTDADVLSIRVHLAEVREQQSRRTNRRSRNCRGRSKRKPSHYSESLSVRPQHSYGATPYRGSTSEKSDPLFFGAARSAHRRGSSRGCDRNSFARFSRRSGGDAMKLKLPAVLVSLFTLLAGCTGANKSSTVRTRTVTPVTTLTVAEKEIPSLYTVSGTVHAKVSSPLASKLLAYVQSVHVREGDRVQAGQVLVTLASEDLDARYRQAQSAHQETMSALPEAESAVSEARANLDLGEVTFRRMQDLYAKRSISDQEFDEATAKIKSARASYSRALARSAQAKDRMAQTEAEVHSAAVDQSYSRIVAPFSGLITLKNVDPGALAVPGTPLLTLERAGAYRLEAPVEESRLSSIRLGQKSLVALDALDCKVEGRVSEIAPVVDAKSRSYVVKIDLPSVPELRSGLFGRVSFESRTQRLLAIPAAAVSRNGQLASVFVIEHGIVELRLITTGRDWNGQTEILSGLHAGDQLIYPVPADLREGMQVELHPASAVR